MIFFTVFKYGTVTRIKIDFHTPCCYNKDKTKTGEIDMDTILIIEDDADLREGLEYTLSGEGYQILTAEKCRKRTKAMEDIFLRSDSVRL